MLLVGAGLMIRTAQALRTVEPGFTHAEHLQTVRISIPDSLIPEPQRVIRTQNDLADKLAGNSRRDIGWICERSAHGSGRSQLG